MHAKALREEFEKLALAGAIGKAISKASGGASRVGKFLGDHEHAIDVAGLGVLAAPAAVGMAHGKEKFHNGAELAGLGILAAPGVAHLLKK